MNKKPIVVQLVRHLGAGSGVGAVVESVEKQFISQGYETERLTLQDTGLQAFVPGKSRTRNKLRLMREVLWFTVAGTALARRRYKNSPDHVIICHGDPVYGDVFVNHGILKQAMKERKSPLLAVARNPMHWFTLLRDEVRYGGRFHRVIVGLTSVDQQQLLANYPRLQVPVRVIPNGVDTQKFRMPSRPERTDAREALSSSESQKNILFVGHEFDRKGLYLLLDAMRLLPENCVVHVVGGDQTMVEEATAYAERGGVASRVRFWGKVSDVRTHFWAADVFCLPTAYETGPLVLLEALACGVPTLMPSVGLAPEVITDELNGYIIPLDSEGIALRLKDVLTRRGEDLQERCRNSVLKYSWDNIGQRYVDLVSEVYVSRCNNDKGI